MLNILYKLTAENLEFFNNHTGRYSDILALREGETYQQRIDREYAIYPDETMYIDVTKGSNKRFSLAEYRVFNNEGLPKNRMVISSALSFKP